MDFYDYGMQGDYLSGGVVSTFTVVALLLSVIGAIAVYFLFLNPKNEKNYTGFVKQLYEFLSFKKLFLEDILKILYLFSAIYITLTALNSIGTSLWLFLIVLVGGNILIRIAYEAALLFIMLYKNVVDINKKLKK